MGADRTAMDLAHSGHRVADLVRSHLEHHHHRVVTLAELSSLTGLSPYRVSRLFRGVVGVPLASYLALVRVRRARSLIAAGMSLAAVAHEVGYSDQSHFSRQFKRIVGMSPGRYARAVSRGSLAVGRDGMRHYGVLRETG